MKKNIQNKLDELKGNLVALLSSNKLKAAILAPMALSLVACGNVSGGSDTPYEPNNPDIPVNPVDPTKEVESRTLNNISGTFSGTSANKKEDILNNSTFTINYNVIYTDGTTDTNITEKVGYTKLRQYFNEDVVSFSVNGDFSETNQTVDLIATINSQINTIISGIKNGNYKDLTNPSAKTVVELLKDILGAEYNTISENVSSGKITLTAQTIKAVGDAFSVLENDAKNGSAQASTEKTVKDNKDAFVAQAQNAITVSQSGGKYTITYNKNFNFNGTFNLDEISFEKINNAKGNFDNATLTNGGSKILIDKLNDIRGSSLPKLVFNTTDYNISDDSSAKETYYLYKAYSDQKNLGKLQLKGNLYYDPIDGKKISGDSNYTLFENGGNTAKRADNGTIRSLTVDTLVQMTKQLNIYKFYNMIISGEATETATVNWELRNIVFEGDMSKIKNNFKNPNADRYLPLYGIVYFKDKPYNNNNGLIGGQSVKGMLKLDHLQGVSSENFEVNFSTDKYSVLDVRGASLDNYDIGSDEKISQNGGYIHAIYFNENYIDFEGNQIKINELCDKFADSGKLGVINAYLGNTKVKGHCFSKPSSGNFSAASRTPRTLKEFEDLGNSFDEEPRSYMQFEHSAKSSYTSDEFNKLDEIEKKSLSEDEGDNLLAKNDRRIEFIDPETQKIIFSVVNDRQYNA
ncbi:MAG: hypothetical protein HDR36_06040 [Treponema sp.]|nr:hypothetical protein [Treponema sp.]